MLRVLLFLSVFPTAVTATPDRVQFSIGSVHTKDEDNKFEAFNPGVFLTWDRPRVSLSAGVFRNSYGDGAFAFVGAWPFWRPDEWEVSAFGALAWYPNGSRFDLSVGNWVPGVGVEVRRGTAFAQIFPSSDDVLDMVITFGVTVPWEVLTR
ncbi:MAG: hypothetical protein AAF762_10055 [Pseudomonadota bacterium]